MATSTLRPSRPWAKELKKFITLTMRELKQFHKPEDEKRSIIVIPEEYRNDWLNSNK